VERIISVDATLMLIAGQFQLTEMQPGISFFSAGYFCNTTIHECKFPDGKILVDSIKIYTASCDGCTEEGVVLHLLGEKNANFLYGVPCQTNTLDHQSTIDFAAGSSVFDGRKGGQEDQTEKNMMGSCYEVCRHIKTSS
jgi:hypothetical protein